MAVKPVEQTTRGRAVLNALILASAALDRDDDLGVQAVFSPKTKELTNAATGQVVDIFPPLAADATPEQRAARAADFAAKFPRNFSRQYMVALGNYLLVVGTATTESPAGQSEPFGVIMLWRRSGQSYEIAFLATRLTNAL